MVGSLGDVVVPFAQDAGGGGGSFWSLAVVLLPMVVAFYFLFILPQQQQEKKRKSMVDSLKKNDKVLTVGGMYGTVVSVDAANDRVVLRVDDERGVRIAVTKASVARVLESAPEKTADGGKGGE
jgi:preprotein translocase subunit YajC